LIRVPDVPLVIITFAQFKRHGFSIAAHCRCGHNWPIDLDEAIARHGPQGQPDYAFKAALACPNCGHVGVGTSIRAIETQ
jgi:hypothetical protein